MNKLCHTYVENALMVVTIFNRIPKILKKCGKGSLKLTLKVLINLISKDVKEKINERANCIHPAY
jgi:hypothetical protein